MLPGTLYDVRRQVAGTLYVHSLVRAFVGKMPATVSPPGESGQVKHISRALMVSSPGRVSHWVKGESVG